MERIPFPQRLNNAKVDIRREYERLYDLFFNQQIPYGSGCYITLHFLCDQSFLKLPLRGTCISLDDFNKTHNYNFKEYPRFFNLDYLLDFCEYTYNLVYFSERCNIGMITRAVDNVIKLYIHQILSVIEKIDYMGIVQDYFMKFIPKDQVVKAAAEKADPNLSPRVFEYNHRSLKGNLERKKDILRAFAHKLEPQLNRIKQFNSSLENNLSCFFNNLDLRHNNVDQNGGNNYKPFVANMKKQEIEQWYDTIYQMCLLAFLGLDYLDHKDKFEQLNQIEQLKQNIRPQKS